MHHGQSRGEKITRKACKTLMNFPKTGGKFVKAGHQKFWRMKIGNFFGKM